MRLSRKFHLLRWDFRCGFHAETEAIGDMGFTGRGTFEVGRWGIRPEAEAIGDGRFTGDGTFSTRRWEYFEGDGSFAGRIQMKVRTKH